ncbi:unnamed protein product [Phyllotreta striolata]|uniref:Uncharacterized protein n=1 Tax=Phyllotreta striolata TaxID=444603 RepID=A0A9N9XT55_PHYSR|nr:unnamed protein product [Phyllotreta striolata]
MSIFRSRGAETAGARPIGRENSATLPAGGFIFSTKEKPHGDGDAAKGKGRMTGGLMMDAARRCTCRKKLMIEEGINRVGVNDSGGKVQEELINFTIKGELVWGEKWEELMKQSKSKPSFNILPTPSSVSYPASFRTRTDIGRNYSKENPTATSTSTPKGAPVGRRSETPRKKIDSAVPVATPTARSLRQRRFDFRPVSQQRRRRRRRAPTSGDRADSGAARARPYRGCGSFPEHVERRIPDRSRAESFREEAADRRARHAPNAVRTVPQQRFGSIFEDNAVRVLGPNVMASGERHSEGKFLERTSTFP